MGMTGGLVLVRDGTRLPPDRIRAALCAVLRKLRGSELYRWQRTWFERSGASGLVAPLEAWACVDLSGRWLMAGDTMVQSGLSDGAAERYGRAFQAAALSLSVQDSDSSRLGYYLPGLELRAVRTGGRYTGIPDVDFPGEELEFPAFLAPYLTEKNEQAMERLWRDRFTYEEDRLAGVLILLDAPGWYEPDSGAPPAGMELIRVSETELCSAVPDGENQ
jgi:hypothetical protein